MARYVDLESKQCTRCKEVKPVDQFSKRYIRKDGTQAYFSFCKVCKVVAYKPYRVANKEKIAEKRTEWSLSNKERIASVNSDWYLINKDHVSRRNQKWKKDNADKVRLMDHRRRSRRLNQYWHDVSDAYLIARDGLFCGWCSTALPATLEGVHRDHIMPLSLGGPHTHHNLTLTCGSCNLKKGAKHPIVFADSIGTRPSTFVFRYIELFRLSQNSIMPGFMIY